MSIEWGKLWACWIGWLIGCFLFAPFTADLKGWLADAAVIGYFLGGVWLFQKIDRRTSRMSSPQSGDAT